MWSDSVKPTTADQTSPATAVLDNVVFTSLMGPHDRLAQRHGRAVRYPVDISGFAALPDRPQPQDWSDLARLVSNAEGVAVAQLGIQPPEGWIVHSRFTVVQMVDDGVDARPDAEAVRLGKTTCPKFWIWSPGQSPAPSRRAPSRWAPTLAFGNQDN
jgi:hypothetical protein